MRVGVIGTGYVGAVQSAGLAHLGHDVISIDIDPNKIKKLQRGELPIFEPGLEELVLQGLNEGRLNYTTDYKALALDGGVEAVFLCLPTPPNEDGSADLKYLLAAASSVAEVLSTRTVLINKSTVPAGTARLVAEHTQKLLPKGVTYDIVSNPEFLREGSAVNDFLNPDTIVIGANSEHAFSVMRKIYAGLTIQNSNILFETDPVSAELIKYARNGFRALKITFANNMAEVAAKLNANIDDIVQAMSMDTAIGDRFLKPGPGWGGSCFPKDSRALQNIAVAAGVPFGQIVHTMDDNERHKTYLANQVINHFGGSLSGKVLLLWGLAFKANTDDIRESPAIHTAQLLTDAGAKVIAFDPEASENAKRHFKNNSRVTFTDSLYGATGKVSSLIIATDWEHFAAPDIERLAAMLSDRTIFDGRNLFDTKDVSNESTIGLVKKHKLVYKSFGRPEVRG